MSALGPPFSLWFPAFAGMTGEKSPECRGRVSRVPGEKSPGLRGRVSVPFMDSGFRRNDGGTTRERGWGSRGYGLRPLARLSLVTYPTPGGKTGERWRGPSDGTLEGKHQ